MAPVYEEFRVQNSPVDICAEHMELMATVVPDMRKQVFMSDRRWISAQCRKEAEEVMPFLLIGGYFWTDSENKEIKALDGINLEIRQGEFVAVIGANGSGKSTLARHFNALQRPSEGVC